MPQSSHCPLHFPGAADAVYEGGLGASQRGQAPMVLPCVCLFQSGGQQPAPPMCLVPPYCSRWDWCCSLGIDTGLPAAAREKQPLLEELRAVTAQEQECWICLSSSRPTGTTDPALLHWLPLAFGPAQLQQPVSCSVPSPRTTAHPVPSLLGRQELGRVPSTEMPPPRGNPPPCCAQHPLAHTQ